MRTLALALLLAAFLLPATPGAAQEKADAAPQPPAEEGFVLVPAGTLSPGCTWANYKSRHQQGAALKKALIYDVWGTVKQEDLKIPAFYLQRYEVTNAQWKLYMDAGFRVMHVCTGQDTLQSLAKKYIQFRDRPVVSEWKAIYGLNAPSIMKAIQAADAEARKQNPKAKPGWKADWTLEDPDPNRKADLGRVFLPKGLELTFYRHRVPSTWYGWCKLSGMRAGGGEYCDVTKPADQAFRVPEELARFKLRADDFARYPIRDLSSNEILAFAEWAGCELPSEYEFERAIRGDRPNTDQHPFPGPWNHRAQKRIFAWADNVLCRQGPLPVDDPTMKPGDTAFGNRNMLGNVYELTRTFYDQHPLVSPKPGLDPVLGALFNYALTAKGGSYGDGWPMLQASTRTGMVGGPAGSLDLSENNRADSLGFRLARHPQPGYDLLLHSILRLTYEKGRGVWGDIRPQHFNMHHMAGVDEVHFAKARAPYLHVTAKAEGIAFAPLWISALEVNRVRSANRAWRQGKLKAGKAYIVLGALRSDIRLRAGMRLNPAEAEKLKKDRAEYKRLKALWDKQQKKRKKKRKKKKGKEAKPIVLPPKPVDPDEYEKETEGKGIGIWREAVIGPGEWFVVYYYGQIGLANKTMIMPPDALLLVRNTKAFRRQRTATTAATLELAVGQDEFTVSFSVEEQLDLAKPEAPPAPKDSELWAWCEVHPDGWIRRKKKSKNSWFIQFSVPVEKGALANHAWNTEPKLPAAPAGDSPEKSGVDKTSDGKSAGDKSAKEDEEE